MILNLPRLSAAEAACLNRLARRDAPHAITFLGTLWSLRLRPLPSGDRGVRLVEPYHLTVDLGGTAAVLAIETAVFRDVLRSIDPGAEVGDVPEPLLLALAELSAEGLLEGLQSALGSAVRLIAAGADRPPDAGPHAFAIALRREGGDAEVAATLALDERGLEAIADLVDRLPGSPDVDPDRWADLPMPLRLEVGRVDLLAGDLAGLTLGDTILMDETSLLESGRLRVRAHSRAALSARLEGSTVIFEDIVRTTMSDDSANPPAEAQSADASEPLLDTLDDVEVRLTFDIGHLTLTLAELRALAPGTSFDLGRDPRRAVNIRANGRLVGTGELVRIDDHVGVRIASLAGTVS